jgi:hypothetical protein
LPSSRFISKATCDAVRGEVARPLANGRVVARAGARVIRRSACPSRPRRTLGEPKRRRGLTRRRTCHLSTVRHQPQRRFGGAATR